MVVSLHKTMGPHIQTSMDVPLLDKGTMNLPAGALPRQMPAVRCPCPAPAWRLPVQPGITRAPLALLSIAKMPQSRQCQAAVWPEEKNQDKIP